MYIYISNDPSCWQGLNLDSPNVRDFFPYNKTRLGVGVMAWLHPSYVSLASPSDEVEEGPHRCLGGFSGSFGWQSLTSQIGMLIFSRNGLGEIQVQHMRNTPMLFGGKLIPWISTSDYISRIFFDIDTPTAVI